MRIAILCVQLDDSPSNRDAKLVEKLMEIGESRVGAFSLGTTSLLDRVPTTDQVEEAMVVAALRATK